MSLYYRLRVAANCKSAINLQEHAKCHQGKRKKDPPWLEGVQLTPELIYEYQMHPKTLNEVLKADMDMMKNLNQSQLVNDQLKQLYLELENFGTELVLEEGITSSGSDSGSSSGSWTESQVRRKTKVVKSIENRSRKYFAV